MVAFFLRAPADLKSVGRGGSTTITFVAKQLNHGLSLPTKRSGIDLCDLVAECESLVIPYLFLIYSLFINDTTMGKFTISNGIEMITVALITNCYLELTK